MSINEFNLVIVGCGFYGATIAHKAASELGIPVLVLDRRPHIGGNCYSATDGRTGIVYHKYGSHLFHTSNSEVWDFVNRFSQFNNYRHRVFARHKAQTFTMPINLMTINRFYGVELTPAEAKEFLAKEIAKHAVRVPQNLEEKAISLIGRALYEAFVKGYTAKQWETDPALLPPEIIARLPVRYSYDDFYFSDAYEGVPVDGYTALFRAYAGTSECRSAHRV